MPSVTLTTPIDNATVAHTFPAAGAYNIEDLGSTGKGNLVRSVVTQGTTTLDTKVCPLPPGSISGSWSVEHAVSGSETLTGCVVTATLVVNGNNAAETNASNITITG